MSSARVLNLSIFAVAAVTLLAAVLFILGNSVGALSNWEPHEPDFTTSPEQTWPDGGTRNMRFVTDMTGAQAWKSIVAIYSQSETVSITIKDAVHCSDNDLFGGAGHVGGDYDGASYDHSVTGVTTTFSLEPYAPAIPAPGSFFGAEIDVTGCNGGLPNVAGASRDITIVRDISGDSQQIEIGGETWYRSKLRADMSGASGGSNTFEVEANDPSTLISYYSQSGNDFVLQDRGSYDGGSPPRLADYHLRFGTECDVVVDELATLEWYDDDNPWINSDIRFNYRMELIERNRATGGITHTWFLNNDGSHNFTQPGESTSGWTGVVGEQHPGYATFTAKPDHIYEWIIHGVMKNNAIQFQLPYDSIYYEYGCDLGSWNYNSSVNNLADRLPTQSFNVTSTVTNAGDSTGLDYTHRIESRAGEGQISMTNGGTNPNAASKDARWFGNPGLAAGASLSHFGTWRVNDNATPGQVCFRSSTGPSEGEGATVTKDYEASPEKCFNIVRNTYTYNPVTTIAGSTLPTSVLTVRGRVTNSGTAGTGAGYRETITVTTGAAHVTAMDADAWNLAGLGAGGFRTRLTHYTINSDAPAGAEVCFTTTISPSTGYATPGTTTGNGSATDTECMNITRNTYNYVPSINVVGSHFPGSVLTITGNITNNGTGGRGPDYDQGIYVNGGQDQLVSYNPVTDSADVGDWDDEPGLLNGATGTNDFTYTIKNDASHGAWICFNTDTNPSQGYATPGNTTITQGWINAWECIQVDNEQYNLEVTVSGFEGVATPGYSFTDIDYTVCNTDIIPPEAARGTAPGVAISSSGNVSAGINIPSTNITAHNCWQDLDNTFTIPTTATVGQQYCTTLTSSKDSGFTNGGVINAGPISDTACITVGIQPYLHVLNGDIWAGANFDDSSPAEDPLVSATCGTDNFDSEIRSVISSSGSVGTFVQYAALATGDITLFGTDGTPNWDSLTFANTTSPQGSYANQPRCIPDYFELMSEVKDNPINSAQINTDALKNTEQSYSNARLELTGGNNYKKHASLVVNGDVAITGDIKYEPNYKPGFGTPLDVPSLVIVASGNIYIDKDVTQVDAILISQGTSGIWTCANADGSHPYTPIENVAENICSEQLTINGALVANRINFMRTHEGGGLFGGVHRNDSEPAEIVNFSPEFFLSEPVMKTKSSDDLTTVLFKDLPPIY